MTPFLAHFGPQKWPFLTPKWPFLDPFFDPFWPGPDQEGPQNAAFPHLKWTPFGRYLKKGVKKGVPKWVILDPKNGHF